jgi:hypothetical protein
MPSSVELFKHPNPYTAARQGGVSLSRVPLKLNMQDPANQDAADEDWAQYLDERGAPPVAGGPVANAKDTARRGSAALRQMYLGFPDSAIYDAMTADMGVPHGYASMGAPTDLSTAVTYGQNKKSLTQMPSGMDPAYSPFQVAHEATHAWKNYARPGFSGNQDQRTLSPYGEEPAPHFPDGLHDRGFLDDLEAAELNTKYGGYGRPGSVPGNPWFMRGRK